MPEYTIDDKGNVIPLPPKATVPIEETDQETPQGMGPMAIEKTAGQLGDKIWGKNKKTNDMSYLFEVPQPEDNDMRTDHLFETAEEDDIGDLTEVGDDLTTVSSEDVMGRPTRPRAKRYRRTGKPYEPPPSMGGIR